MINCTENDVTEIRFVPDDKSVLEFLFKNMNDCQLLHPDATQSDSDDQDDDDGANGGGDVAEGQFDDPEEDD